MLIQLSGKILQEINFDLTSPAANVSRQVFPPIHEAWNFILKKSESDLMSDEYDIQTQKLIKQISKK